MYTFPKSSTGGVWTLNGVALYQNKQPLCSFWRSRQGQKLEENSRIYFRADSTKPSVWIKRDSCTISKKSLQYINLQKSTDSHQSLFGESKWVLVLCYKFLPLTVGLYFRQICVEHTRKVLLYGCMWLFTASLRTV